MNAEHDAGPIGEHTATAGREPVGGQVGTLRAQAVIDGEIIAALAGQGQLDRAEIAQLHDALATSRRIGAAMGILMATLKIDEGAAFGRLRETSQTSNRKLRDVAEDVVFTGALEQRRQDDDRRVPAADR